MAMAPPGTQYRPPGYPSSSQYAQTQSQTQHFDVSDDGSSDEPDHSADIKPSAFTKGSNGVPARIEESPFKNFASQFTYQSPQKRSSDDMASAYASAQRKPKIPRQIGPAKALPPSATGGDLDENMGLGDIMDFGLREKVYSMRQTFPMHSVGACFRALMARRGHVEDALEFLTREADAPKPENRNDNSIDLTSEGDEEPIPLPRQNTAKRDVGKSATINEKWSSKQHSTKQLPSVPTRSISEKYATQNSQPQIRSPVQGPVRKPGRILNRKKPGTGQSSSPVWSPVKSAAKASSRRRHVIDEDDDDEEEQEVDAEDTDDDSGVDVVDISPVETRLLDMLNSCSSEELVDLAAGSSTDVIEKVLAQRPFGTLDNVRQVSIDVTQTTKNGKTRATKRKIGDKLVDTCIDMMTGFNAVDDLVVECERLGKPMAKDMKQWGLNAFGASSMGGGELDMTDLESAHDSGIGTPSSTPSNDGEGRRKILKQPKMLSPNVTLMDHQVAGLNWLSLLWAHGLSGILADDMGLGKTLQVIAYLTYLKEAELSNGPHLVIVPGSTIENWLREFQTFSPSLRVEPYYGGIGERPRRQLQIKDEISRIHVVVTTYDMAVKPDDTRFLRRDVNPVVCVWDEAHELKNSQSKKYKSLIKIPASQRLMLTGTPVQNNLTEMASLLAFLMPNVFSRREDDLQIIFKNKAKLDTAAGAGKSSSNEKHAALLSADRISRARSMITPFILRRKKHQVLKSLPKKTSTVEYCKLEGDQAALYHEIEDNYRTYLASKRKRAETKSEFVDEGAVGANALKLTTRRTKTAAELEKSKEDAVSSILTSLRKAAIHPLLFRRHYNDELLHKMTTTFMNARENKGKDYNSAYVLEDLQICTDFELHRWCLATEQPSVVRKFALKGKPWLDGSAKVKKLISLLKEHAQGGHKTLVFSQFTTVMDILESALSEVNMVFFRLDGSTKMEQRQDLIDEFHQAPAEPDAENAARVFLLSTGAGGQGINLACANRVIIFDSGFNPHQDLQAENRAHRVGQTRDVIVSKLVSEGTIEEQILKVGQVKVKLDEEVAGGGDAGLTDAVDSGAVTPNGEQRNEKQGKGMVETLLAEKLEGKTDVKNEEGEEHDDQPTEVDTEVKEGQDVADAFAERLKNAGVNVQK